MPQLVKGGKNVFGWTNVSAAGRVAIPRDAFAEYGFKENETVIVMPGSRTSGGFALVRTRAFKRSPVSAVLAAHPGWAGRGTPEGEIVTRNAKFFCRARIRERGITLPFTALKRYGVGKGDRLLAVRGSGLGLGFIVRGPIVEEAKKHKELAVCG